MFFNDEKEQSLEILRNYGLPISNSNWWTRFPRRAVEEIYKLEENTGAIFVSCSNNKLIWEEDIINNLGTLFTISIEVCSGYPFSMPKVYVTDSDIDISDVKHQYSEGMLCLMHPDDYHSNISILDIRNLAATWCLCADIFVQTGSWPAAEAD